MGNEQGRLGGEPTPAGIQSMDESLQKKFAKGIQYNMKIVIRGDRNTGKSCLFRRMEGKPYDESYVPTDEIQVTSILWSYKVTNDTVKVEIWDVVDQGRTKRKSERDGAMLKMINDPDVREVKETKALDAVILDVYKGAHGVVFLYDITKQWTWQYIERELPKVPFSLPVMIIGNFRDMGDHRVVSREVCSYYIEHMERPEGAADVRYAEASMKNGFGLMHLHKFLSIPFLHLQQETLLLQLQVNREQMLAAREELNSAHVNEDQNYDLFERKLERLAEERGRRRTKSIEQEVPGAGDESPTTPKRRDVIESERRVVGEDSPDLARHVHQQPHQPTPPSSSSTTATERKGSFKSKLTSKLSGFLSRPKEEPVKEEDSDLVLAAPPSRPRAKPTSKVEDFVPEGDVDSFLGSDEDEEEEDEDEEEDSDDDTHTGKPQIAMDEDLSSPEEEEAPPPAPPTSAATKPSPQVTRPPVVLKSAKDVELTESEEEEDTPEVMADEDAEEERVAAKSVGSKKTKDVLSGELFDVEPVAEKKKKSSSKSSGLMLEFNLPPPQPKAKASTESKKKESPLDTPEMSEKRRDSKSKKKKSKKSRHDKEDAEVTQSGGGAVQAPPTVSDDPFGAISALDAWLNSDSTDVMGESILQPSQVDTKKQDQSKTKSVLVEVGNEEEGEEEESPETQHKKTKKHKHHKKHRRGERDDEEEGRTSKRKHRHRSSKHGGSSTGSRPSEETVGDYNEL